LINEIKTILNRVTNENKSKVKKQIVKLIKDSKKSIENLRKVFKGTKKIECKGQSGGYKKNNSNNKINMIGGAKELYAEDQFQIEDFERQLESLILDVKELDINEDDEIDITKIREMIITISGANSEFDIFKSYTDKRQKCNAWKKSNEKLIKEGNSLKDKIEMNPPSDRERKNLYVKFRSSLQELQSNFNRCTSEEEKIVEQEKKKEQEKEKDEKKKEKKDEERVIQADTKKQELDFEREKMRMIQDRDKDKMKMEQLSEQTRKDVEMEKIKAKREQQEQIFDIEKKKLAPPPAPSPPPAPIPSPERLPEQPSPQPPIKEKKGEKGGILGKMKSFIGIEEEGKEGEEVDKQGKKIEEDTLDQMVDFMENIFEDDNVQAKLRSEDVRKVDDVIENWQSLYREHEELEDKLKQQQQLYDYKETEFDKLLDQKDETIDQLSSRLVNLQSQLKKFKNSCKKKIEGIQALEEQNDVEDLRENTEVFDLAISEFNERIKECKNELRRISQEKEKEMKDIDFLKIARFSVKKFTKNIEDNLSDKLHEELTRSFIDKKVSILSRGLKQDMILKTEVRDNDKVCSYSSDMFWSNANLPSSCKAR